MREGTNLGSVDDFLRSVFGNLPGAVQAAVAGVAARRVYIPGERIIVEGERPQAAYLIREGDVEVFRTSTDGRRQVLACLRSAQWFNVLPCLNAASRCPATVAAITPVELLVIEASDLRRLLGRHPELALMILKGLADHTRNLVRLVEGLSLHSTRGRVARFLLDHEEETGIIYWHLTQSDIADRLGTVQDVVGRILRGFADEGLIAMPRKHCIVIRDREGLRDQANQ